METVGFEGLSFTEELLAPRAPRRLDAIATLAHLAFMTYAVEPERVRPHVDGRFQLHTYTDSAGRARVWVSLVTFLNRAFHFRGLPHPRLTFGQTNYRTYVVDRVTGERGVWFFGATLPWSATLAPRFVWSLPWHPGRVDHDCIWDEAANRYTRYRMNSRSEWANADVELADTGQRVSSLKGIADLEAGLVALTHPLHGFCRRRRGGLASVPVWHDRLQCTTGRVARARIDLFDRLDLVPFKTQCEPHSVLLLPSARFVAHLPPLRLDRR